MDMPAIQAWFSALPKSDKVLALLTFMFEITIVVRAVFHDNPHDCETRSRLAYHLSEMNHAFTSAAIATIKNEPTYPDDILLEILLDQASYPELESYCRYVLVTTIQRVNKAQEGRTT
jgi:hypothetical protein